MYKNLSLVFVLAQSNNRRMIKPFMGFMNEALTAEHLLTLLSRLIYVSFYLFCHYKFCLE